MAVSIPVQVSCGSTSALTLDTYDGQSLPLLTLGLTLSIPVAQLIEALCEFQRQVAQSDRGSSAASSLPADLQSGRVIGLGGENARSTDAKAVPKAKEKAKAAAPTPPPLSAPPTASAAATPGTGPPPPGFPAAATPLQAVQVLAKPPPPPGPPPPQLRHMDEPQAEPAPERQLMSSQEGGESTNEGNEPGVEFLDAAGTRRWEECLRILRSGTPAVNAQSRFGRTALHYAAWDGRADVVAALLQRNDFTGVNAKECYGRTALHCAALNRHADVCRLLLKHPRFTEGEARDKIANSTALDLAQRCNYTEVVQIIMAETVAQRLRQVPPGLASMLPKGVNPSSQALEAPGSTAARAELLEAASSRRWEDCFQLIHTPGAPINAQSQFGRSVLHYAAWDGRLDMVEALLQHPDFTQINAKECYGRTALHCAALNGHSEVCRVLLQHPRFTEVEARDQVGNSTAYELAVKSGGAETVKVFKDLEELLAGGPAVPTGGTSTTAPAETTNNTAAGDSADATAPVETSSPTPNGGDGEGAAAADAVPEEGEASGHVAETSQ